MPIHRIESLQDLVRRGGTREVEEDDVTSLRDLPAYTAGLCYVFHQDGLFTFVVPDEVLPALTAIDWEDALARAVKRQNLIAFFDALVELRGIVPYGEAIAQYHERYPDGYSSDEEIGGLINQAIFEGLSCFELLETKAGERYILYFELYDAWRDGFGEESAARETSAALGELGESLEGLLALQAKRPPRPVDPEMLEAPSLLEWKMERGEAIAFLQYLDAHVPNCRDDYLFADKVVEELLIDSMWGLETPGADRLFEILEDNDFIPDADQVQEVIDLWVALCEAMPNWPNNGWAPVDAV